MRKFFIINMAVILLISSILEFSHVQAAETDSDIDPDTACQQYEFYLDSPVEGDNKITGQGIPSEVVVLKIDGKKHSEVIVNQQQKFTFPLDEPITEKQSIEIEIGNNKIKANVVLKDQSDEKTVELSGNLDCRDLKMTEKLIEEAERKAEEEAAQAEAEEAERKAEEEAAQAEAEEAERKAEEEAAQAEAEEAERKAEEEAAQAEAEEAERKAEEEAAQAEAEEAERKTEEEAAQAEAEEAERKAEEEAAQAEAEEAEREAEEEAEQTESEESEREAEKETEQAESEESEREAEQTESEEAEREAEEETEQAEAEEAERESEEETEQAESEESEREVEEETEQAEAEEAEREAEEETEQAESEESEREAEEETEQAESEEAEREVEEETEQTDFEVSSYGIPSVMNSLNCPASRPLINRPAGCVYNTTDMHSDLRNSSVGTVQHMGNFTHNINIGSVTIASNSRAKIWDGNNSNMTFQTIAALANYNLSNSTTDGISTFTLRNFNSINMGEILSLINSAFLNSSGNSTVNVQNVNFSATPSLLLSSGRSFFNGQSSVINFSGTNNISSPNNSSVLTTGSMSVMSSSITNITQLNNSNTAAAVSLAGNTLSVASNAQLNILSQGVNIHKSGSLNINVGSNAYFNLVNNTGGGRLFSSTTNATINADGMVLGLWGNTTTGRPVQYTRTQSRMQFNVNGNNVSAVNMVPSVNNFNTRFNLSDKRRMVIESPSQKPVLNRVAPGSNSITGTAAPNSRVYLTDTPSISTTANASGQFTLNLSSAAADGSTIRVDAIDSGKNIPSEAAEIRVERQVLEFAQSPKDIIFETTEIKNEDNVNIPRTEDNYSFQIRDTRNTQSWRLNVRADSPMTNQQGDTLNNSLVYYDGSTYRNIETNAVQVASSTDYQRDSNGISTVTWQRDRGILLRLNPITASPSSAYSTKLTWTLTDGP
ncbi:Ig-like domain-containing protein [Corticicoccus populi]|uniref:Ig-like domain-containing protein n=1 Tax=Corticicoccus populi TaxID=1812821 RepID=A0ABW5WU39_9STAP